MDGSPDRITGNPSRFGRINAARAMACTGSTPTPSSGSTSAPRPHRRVATGTKAVLRHALRRRARPDRSGQPPSAALVLAVALVAAACGAGTVGPLLHTVSGSVLRARGQPVAGARVAFEEFGASAVTGPDGSFVIAAGRSGSVLVRVRSEGYGPLDWPVSALPEGLSLRLALAAAADFDPSVYRVLTGWDEPWAGSRWPGGAVSYFVENLHTAPQGALDVLRQSFDKWSMLTGGRLRFAETREPAQVLVRYADADPCGFKEMAGCTGLVASDGLILSVFVEFAAAYSTRPWTVLHELGHAIGLDDSPDPDHIMYVPPPRADWPSNAEAAVVAVLYGNLPAAPLHRSRPGQVVVLRKTSSAR